MRIHLLIACLVASTSLLGPARAGDAQSENAQALQQTQNLLDTPSLREKAIAKRPAAGLVSAQVRSLAGNGATEESIYGASAGIFDKLSRDAQGDPERMSQLLKKAKDDPKAFYDSLSEEDKKAIHGISLQIVEGRSGSTPPVPAALK